MTRIPVDDCSVISSLWVLIFVRWSWLRAKRTREMDSVRKNGSNRAKIAFSGGFGCLDSSARSVDHRGIQRGHVARLHWHRTTTWRRGSGCAANWVGAVHAGSVGTRGRGPDRVGHVVASHRRSDCAVGQRGLDKRDTWHRAIGGAVDRRRGHGWATRGAMDGWR